MKRSRVSLLILACAGSAMASEVGYWSFDENGGNFVGDGTPFANHGTLLNGTGAWVPGRSGSALQFAGNAGSAGARVEILDSPSLRLSTGASFAAWIRSEDIGRDAPILAKEGPGGLAYWFGTFGLNGAGHWGVLFDQNGGYNWDFNGRDQGASPLGEWVHLAATWDGALTRYYLNGSLANSIPWAGTIFQTDAKLVIGQNSDWLTTSFKGTIDEVHLYDNAISANDVARLAGVPEPASLAVLGVGLAWLAKRRRR